MNTRKVPNSPIWKASDHSWASEFFSTRFKQFGILILLVGLVFSGACNSALPTAGTNQPSDTATPDATGTAAAEIAKNVPIVDDGKPLAPQVVDQKPKGGQELGLTG